MSEIINSKLSAQLPLKETIMSKIAGHPIHMVRVYQAVQFNKRQETTFLAEGHNGKPGHEFEVMKEFNNLAIKIWNKNDAVVVPLTNVSSINLKSKLTEDNAAEAEADAKAKASINHKQQRKARG